MHYLAFLTEFSYSPSGPVSFGLPGFPFDTSFFVTITIVLIFSILISVFYFEGEKAKHDIV